MNNSAISTKSSLPVENQVLNFGKITKE